MKTSIIKAKHNAPFPSSESEAIEQISKAIGIQYVGSDKPTWGQMLDVLEKHLALWDRQHGERLARIMGIPPCNCCEYNISAVLQALEEELAQRSTEHVN